MPKSNSDKKTVTAYIDAGYTATCQGLISNIPEGLAGPLTPGRLIDVKNPSVGAGNILQGVADLIGLRLAVANTNIIKLDPGAISVYGYGLGGAIAAGFGSVADYSELKVTAISMASTPADIMPSVLQSPTLSLLMARAILADSTSYSEWATGENGHCKIEPHIQESLEYLKGKDWGGLIKGILPNILSKLTCIARYKLTDPQGFANDTMRYAGTAQAAYTKVDPSSLLAKIPDGQNLLVLMNENNHRYPITEKNNSLAGIEAAAEAAGLKHLNRTAKCSSPTSCANRKMAVYRWGGNSTIIQTLSNMILFSNNVGPLRDVRNAMNRQNSSFLISGGTKIKVKELDKPLLKRW